ncbi:MAG: 2-oxoacid:acceptor oxidoreductase family protein [Sulfolobales archaeon]
MRIEILIAGRGGQGILLMGRVLGKALSRYTNYYVIGSESYAAEVRGGDSRVDLIVSDREEEADFIRVYRANIAIFMHQTQLEVYREFVDKNATVFIDKTNLFDQSLVPSSWRSYIEPYTYIAEKILGLSRVANMIALGHMILETRIIDIDKVEEILIGEFRDDKDLLEKNIRALRYYSQKKLELP